MNTELWPPLSVIRNAFENGPAAVPDAGPAVATVAMPGAVPGAAAAAAATPALQDLLLPLTELARRREAVAQRAFPARWAPGRLISVVHEGRLLGVLLDRCIHGDLWQGWMAAGEADWAGAFDVLLEPDDEPFEPAFGLIQAWNVLTLEPSPQLCARVLGEVSATRLAAIRAVHDEWAAQKVLPIAPEPGRVALRTVGGVFSVLSGTPLGAQDPRADYQALYRTVGMQLGAAPVPSSAASPADPAPPRARPQERPEGGWWGSIRRWFGADGWMRPAFAVLALCVVVQNVGLLGGRASEEDEVRFRNVPTAPATASANLVVRWKDGVRVDEADRLLRTISAEVVGGPGTNGVWRLRVNDPVGGLSLLAASPLVESAGPASERP
ncbi:hypothetical protein M2282_005869 [Variovorax boronicumulans]|uniref:hypothetical protein n=1 Tax=Variovorax boronicumulans TaxID=436515 RepID=UPI002473D54B|nr:hypothetical protein [Variovorax boronicumulans]MDH6170694.1 hypothetical protein [Variovorax boronicumulans]